MGVIETNTVALRCLECGTTETLIAVEKGSGYGRGWTDFKESAGFVVESEEDAIARPHIVSAKCKKCGCDAIREQIS
jgi:hypothetical protein